MNQNFEFTLRSNKRQDSRNDFESTSSEEMQGEIFDQGIKSMSQMKNPDDAIAIYGDPLHEVNSRVK